MAAATCNQICRYCNSELPGSRRQLVLHWLSAISLLTVVGQSGGIIGVRFFAGGPHLIIQKESLWSRLLRWHHFNLYFFFGLLGVANILCSTISSLPVSLTKLMMSNAFLMEVSLWASCGYANIVHSLYIIQILILYPQFPMLPRMTSCDHQPRRHSHEDQKFRNCAHMRYYRKCSVDGSLKESLESKGSSHSKIQEFSESFEQQLCIKTKRSVSLGPESRKERNEKECLRMEIRSRKKLEERRSSAKEEHQEASVTPLVEKGSK
ncbi:Leukemia NUP98 fusion partner 1 [Sciurus carolinensis]|uniref:Leukemia NUP98 fusion partner 1 n=1 Tax=Sciurus carolinensis TaxID=30640 RepID=A0AA41SXX1_SCICA|nr:Leukemia NUP98 fusion partner 1 [Sciurus carolinensis]